MNANQFIATLRSKMADLRVKQVDLAKQTQISQPTLHRIINGNGRISLSHAISLWPFVYGMPFPYIPESQISYSNPPTTESVK